MKKWLSILCAVILFGGLNLQAAPVSPTRALDIAKRVFASQPATKAGTGEVKIIWDGEDIATKADRPAFYVISRDGGGFVIIAGDDNVQPVLGISDRNAFKVEGMPKNVRAWMEYIKGYVRSTKTQTPEIGQQWAQMVATKAPLSGVTDEYKEKWTCEWDQHNPANLLAPQVVGQEIAVAGCLPLAIAEIMTWHGAPNSGTGYSTAYSYTSKNGETVNIPSYNLSDYVSLTDANWAGLQNLKTNSQFKNCSDVQLVQISKLVLACGVILGARYNDGAHGGTSASSADVVAAFGEHMGYNKGAYRDFLVNHPLREWVSNLKNEINKRPVLYCGQSKIGGNDAGHAYVFDGYATLGTDDVFHVNFGWGGSCNGYYYAAYQDTRPDQNYNYNMDLEAFFDFYPKASSSYVTRLDAFFLNNDFPGVRVYKESEHPEYGYCITSCIINRGADNYTGKLKFVLKKKDGSPDQLLQLNDGSNKSEFDASVAAGHYIYKDLGYFDINFSFGDKVVCYYKDGENWVLLGGPFGFVIDEWPLIPTPFIKTADSYNVGDYFDFRLMNHTYTYSGTTWTITAPDGTVTADIPQANSEFKLTQSGPYKIQADVKPSVGGSLTETIVTYITVN